MISSTTIKILDHQTDSYCISVSGSLTKDNLTELRTEVMKSTELSHDIIYIDTMKVHEIDLSGINELIHSHYQLSNAAKQLVLVYQRNSAIESWAETTGFDKIIATAITPEP